MLRHSFSSIARVWAVGLGLALANGPALSAAEPPDLILHHGRIVTVDDRFTIAEAIAIRGERIALVGGNAEVLATREERTKLVDLGGKLVLPGLIDSHVHPLSACLHEFDHPVPDMESIADLLAYVAARAKARAKGEWIVVRQIFITRLKEQRYPTREELDRAAPDHPVMFATGPDAMLNSLALWESGIDRDFQAIGAGQVEKDPRTGEPTGMLRGCTQYAKAKPSGRTATTEEKLKALAALFADYNSVGLTCVSDRNASAENLDLYQALRQQQRLNVRMMASHAVDAAGKLDAVRDSIHQIAQHPLRRVDDKLRIIGVKTFLDGGMLTGSALMREPWGVSQIYSIRDPQYRGVRFIEPEKLTAIVRTTVESSLQFTAHSTGDGAVHALLDAYEEVNRGLPIQATRPCITHCNFMSREALEKMRALGVVADIQPAWLYLDARTLSAQFGDARLRWFQPLGAAFDLKVVMGGGSDHMQKIGSLRSINPYNPFLGMWVAITRQAKWYEGKLHPEESLTREQAIRLYTRNNAYLLFLEHETGSLEAGKAADLVILDRDLLTCPEDDIRGAQCLATYLAGKLVYEKK